MVESVENRTKWPKTMQALIAARRVVAPYGEAETPFTRQCAAARGCSEYEVLVASLVDTAINTRQSRAARYVLPTTAEQTANTSPALRDVRRAIKIFSYTVHGAFFFISEKEWGVQALHRPRCKFGGRVIPAPAGALNEVLRQTEQHLPGKEYHMPFWKKSDDPWDIDPAKKKQQAAWWEADPPAQPDPDVTAEAEPRLGDTLKSLFQTKETEEDTPIPAEKCPWCGKDMEWGCITGGRDGVVWRNWKPRGLGLSRPDGWKELDLLEEGEWRLYKTAGYCGPCGKMVLDAPKSPYARQEKEAEKLDLGSPGFAPDPKAYEKYQAQVAQWNSEKET